MISHSIDCHGHISINDIRGDNHKFIVRNNNEFIANVSLCRMNPSSELYEIYFQSPDCDDSVKAVFSQKDLDDFVNGRNLRFTHKDAREYVCYSKQNDNSPIPFLMAKKIDG